MWTNLTKKLAHIAEDITTPQYDDDEEEENTIDKPQSQRRVLVDKPPRNTRQLPQQASAQANTTLPPRAAPRERTTPSSSTPGRVVHQTPPRRASNGVARSLSRDLLNNAQDTPASTASLDEKTRRGQSEAVPVQPIRGPPAARLPTISATLVVPPAAPEKCEDAAEEHSSTTEAKAAPALLSSSLPPPSSLQPHAQHETAVDTKEGSDRQGQQHPARTEGSDAEDKSSRGSSGSHTRSASGADTHKEDNDDDDEEEAGRRRESETRRLAELETLRGLMQQLERDKEDEAARQQTRYEALEQQHRRALAQLADEWEQRLRRSVSEVEQRVRRECAAHAEEAAAAAQASHAAAPPETHTTDREAVAQMKEEYEKRLAEANTAAALAAAQAQQQQQASLAALQRRLSSVEAERDGLAERVRVLEQERQASQAEYHALHERARAMQEELERTQGVLRARELAEQSSNNKHEGSDAAALAEDAARREAQWRGEKAELTRQKGELEERLSHYEELVHQLQHTITDCLQRADVALPHTTRRARRRISGNANDAARQEGDLEEEDDREDEDNNAYDEAERSSSASARTSSTALTSSHNAQREERMHGLTFSDLVIVLTSEFSKQRAVLRKAERVQREWENTYAQARTVNQTLQQQVSDAWKTIGTLREESSVKDALIDKLQGELSASEQVQAAEQGRLAEAVNEVRALQEEREAWALRADAAAEGATAQLAQLSALQGENAQLKATLQDRDDELATAHRSLENLQQVLQTFKERRKEAIEESTMDLQAEIDELKAQLARLAPLREQCDARLEQQRVQHAKELASRNVELTALHRKLAELRRALEVSARQLNGETMIDKTVVSHLLVSYIQAFVGQKKEADEVLKVMSGLLNWDEALQERAGLLPGPNNPRPGQQQHTLGGGAGKGRGGLLHWMRRPQAASGAVGNASLASSTATQPSASSERASLATLWVEFLIRESERGSNTGAKGAAKHTGSGEEANAAVEDTTPTTAALSMSGVNISTTSLTGPRPAASDATTAATLQASADATASATTTTAAVVATATKEGG